MDKGDWNQFIEMYYEKIYRFCFHLLSSHAEAQESTQNTFLKAFKARFRPSKSEEKAWIYSIARNDCIDRTRWWKRFGLFKQSIVMPSLHVSADMTLPIQILDALQKLPAKQKQVFVLRHWHGFSTSETAKLLKINEGTVKTHLKRGIDKMKEELTLPDEI